VDTIVKSSAGERRFAKRVTSQQLRALCRAVMRYVLAFVSSTCLSLHKKMVDVTPRPKSSSCERLQRLTY
jgi:hypothetical protein